MFPTTTTTRPPTVVLVGQSNNLISRHMVEQGFDTRHDMVGIWKAQWDLPRKEIHDIPTPSRITCDALKNIFLAK